MADKTNIPAGPWREQDLGKELYEKLALEYGVCSPEGSYRPDMDLTVAYKEQEAKTKKPAPSIPAETKQ